MGHWTHPFPCLYHGFLTCDTGVSSIQSMMDRIIIIQSIMDRIIISSINIDIIFLTSHFNRCLASHPALGDLSHEPAALLSLSFNSAKWE